MRDTLPAITRAWEADLGRSWAKPRAYDKTHMSSVLGCGLRTYYTRITGNPQEYDFIAQARMQDGLRQERSIIEWFIQYSKAETEAWAPGGLKILKAPKRTKSGRLSKRSYPMLDDGHDYTSPTAVENPELELIGRADAFLIDTQGQIIVVDSKVVNDKFGDAIAAAKREVAEGIRDSVFDWLWHSAPFYLFYAPSICGQIAGYVHEANRKFADILKQPVTTGVLIFKTRSGQYHPVLYDAREYPFLWDLIEKQALEIKHAIASGDTSHLHVNKNAVMCNMCQHRDICSQKIIGSAKYKSTDPAWYEAVKTKLTNKKLIAVAGQAHNWLKWAAHEACPDPEQGEKASIEVDIEELDATVYYTKSWTTRKIHMLIETEKESRVAVIDFRRLNAEEIEQGYVVVKESKLDGRLHVVDKSKKKKAKPKEA